MRVHAHNSRHTPHAAQGAAALSAAVTSTYPIGNRSQLPWTLISKRKVKPIPSHSSGGGPGEALLREAASPAFSSSPLTPHQGAAALSAAVTSSYP